MFNDPPTWFILSWILFWSIISMLLFLSRRYGWGFALMAFGWFASPRVGGDFLDPVNPGVLIPILTAILLITIKVIAFIRSRSKKTHQAVNLTTQPLTSTSMPWSNLIASTPNSTSKGFHKIIDNRPTLQKTLNDAVVGQPTAKSEIVKYLSVILKKQELQGTTSRILATFFFVGPTGVGKTETAKAIADYFKQFGYQFLRFDMGGFSDYHTASTLLGSPAGYMGSDQGGALTRPLMQNPRAVILFDEIEKAHSSLFRTFMTLIDEGEIQEISTGVRVRTDNAIIIFTSNLYQDLIGKLADLPIDDIEKEAIIRDILTGNLASASKYVRTSKGFDRIIPAPDYDNRNFMTNRFPPEFIGRIDKVIPFTHLTEQDYEVIVLRIAAKYHKSVDAKAVAQKYLPIAQRYGVRQFIKKVEEELLGV